MNTYLSSLMGAEDIVDNELGNLGIKIAKRASSGIRMLNIPDEALPGYIELVKNKLTKGFWNEIVGPSEILFVFKFADGHTEEYTLSPENEQKIDRLCAEFNNEPADKTANVYKYISDNEFYRDFMLKHYADMVNR